MNVPLARPCFSYPIRQNEAIRALSRCWESNILTYHYPTRSRCSSRSLALRLCWTNGTQSHAALANMATYSMAVCATSNSRHLMVPYFFSNLPHKKNGPGRELYIRVNLGVDWYMYYPLWFWLTKFCCRFSYICSNIVPSHSSCLMSFSICNLPPGYQYIVLGIFVCLTVGFPGTAHQISCAQASFQVWRNKTLMKFNASYGQLFLIFYACGRMASYA